MEKRLKKFVLKGQVQIPSEGMEFLVKLEKEGSLLIDEVPILEEQSSDRYKYFQKISTRDRLLVQAWLNKQKPNTMNEEKFLELVGRGIRNINYDYWIPTIEPTVINGKIEYVENCPVAVGFSANDWLQFGKAYAPERGSRRGTDEEVCLWYALRIVKGYWSLDYVANDSSKSGNYKDSPDASLNLEKTGARVCGGFKDGQGNTYKIVTKKNVFATIGGFCNVKGSQRPVADFFEGFLPNYKHDFGTGIIVLTR